ncbi:Protein kinase-like domain-containing protein [Cynara cardunculus var. scolymus]|uniref:Protein kinase-like domain-containing protein n=1 Tax=Cynara cardunculus var. scolymus TaxID=59895 RepID=A0A103Y384_CYNCS|nr:Protein kinase-like domain-containing protein [Cynara cardunculus var. scolymus]
MYKCLRCSNSQQNEIAARIALLLTTKACATAAFTKDCSLKIRTLGNEIALARRTLGNQLCYLGGEICSRYYAASALKPTVATSNGSFNAAGMRHSAGSVAVGGGLAGCCEESIFIRLKAEGSKVDAVQTGLLMLPKNQKQQELSLSRYYISNHLTEKSDIYSFGVILLELISVNIQNGDIQRIIDPALRDEYDVQSMWKMAEKALMCVQPHPNMRPSMSEVIKEIQDAISIERGVNGGTSDEILRSSFHSSLNMGLLDAGIDPCRFTTPSHSPWLDSLFLVVCNDCRYVS